MKKIFVSSTFKDMQFERDILHETVLPGLNLKAMEYGESLSLCDLRWGVDTTGLSEAESARKVLSVCLDEIDRCRPYMLIIIGARYGWIPDAETSEDFVRRRIQTLRDLERSVTEMEIEYGALSNKMNRNCLFYFRNADYSMFPVEYRSEDQAHARLLEDLKGRIRAFAGEGRLREYTVSWKGPGQMPDGMKEFASMVRDDILDLMRGEWEYRLKLSVWEKECILQRNLAAERAQQFAAREGLVRQLEDGLALSEIENGLVIVRGAGGSGKSMLLSRAAQVLGERGEEVFPVFCGSSALSGTADNVVRCMIRRLETLTSFTDESPESESDSMSVSRNRPQSDETPELDSMSGKECLERLAELVRRYGQNGNKRLTFVIDAVDQLIPDETRDKFRFIPSNLGGKVRMVISMPDSFPLPAGLQARLLQITPLDADERTQIVRGILGFQSKELDTGVIERLARKQAAGNPLYLSILLQRLLLMDQHDFEWIRGHGDGQQAITAFEIKLIDEMPDDMAAALIEVFRYALEKAANPAVTAAVSYISMSRYGLRPEDLAVIVSGDAGRADGRSFNLLDFAVFTGYLRSFFLVREDGRYDFSHRVVREAMYTLWDNPEKLHLDIFSALMTLDPHDEVRRSELIWHCFGARRGDLFFACMRQKDEDSRKKAALTLKDCCMQDKDGWILQQVRSLEGAPAEKVLTVAEFLLHDFAPSLHGTEDDLRIGVNILENALLLIHAALRGTDAVPGKLPAADAAHEKRSTPDSVRPEDALHECLRLLGRFSYERGPAYADKACRYLEEACGMYGKQRITAMLKEGMERDKAL